MKRLLFVFTFLAGVLAAHAQQTVSGTVYDITTGDGLVGAVVMADSGKAVAICDVNGRYRLSLPDGEYVLNVRFVGYTAPPAKVRVAGKPVTQDFYCEAATMKEVRIVADVAIDRKTPVAFSNIPELRIREELGSRDQTMLLNSTPGAYATEQGGGMGDSRVSIRGVDQRNIGVMVDGVPMNDMENGQVYWSNWSGLPDVTRTMQVQRGLGASRLAIPSVGGTINILTRGIDDKRGYYLRADYGNNNMQKFFFGFNSGMIGKGWGFTIAASRRTGNGWVEQTWDDQYSYYFKVQKRFEKHLLSFSVNGAPQKHGQRYDRLPIGVLDRKYAEKLGVNIDSLYTHLEHAWTTPYQGERGRKYNPNWGFIHYPDGQTGRFNQDINFFHKPLFNLSWFWTPNDKFMLSTVTYLSLGYGGGTNFNSSINIDTTSGQLNLTQYYNANSSTIDALYSTTEHKSTRALLASMNNHVWYGALSTATWMPAPKVTVLFGLDVRHYKGSHFRKVYDLLGGDYYIDNSAGRDQNLPNGMGNEHFAMKREGDKVGYWNDSYVDWGGLFAQAEYAGTRWSAFVTLTGSMTQYERVDHFKKRDIILDDGTIVPMIVGYNEVYYTNGTADAVAMNGAVVTTSGDTTVIDNPTGPTYTLVGAKAYAWSSDAARTARTKKKTFPGYTIKAGANYNLTENYNIFLNAGYMEIAPRFSTVFDNNNNEYPGIKSQHVTAVELGVGARFRRFAANANLYFTDWQNKPPVSMTITTPDGRFTYDILGLNTTLMGIELDGSWKIAEQLSVEGVVSLGDWQYHSSGTAYLYDADYNLVDTIDYSVQGVHVGDAAQTQFGGSVRWQPFKGFYIKPRYTWFGRHYASFDPVSFSRYNDGLGGYIDNRDRESWHIPSYGQLDLFAGYEVTEEISKKENKSIRVSFNLAVTNLLDTTYITDAENGDHFDAGSASVYLGLGRRWSVGMRITF